MSMRHIPAPLPALVLALALALSLGLSAPGPALAVQPDEILDDPALEARARSISAELRCVVCRSESIDDSNAPLARDLRLLVRERLLAGDSDVEVKSYVVDRFGEFVLLRPVMSGANLVLWLSGPAMLMAALALGAVYLRRRRVAAAPPPLSPAEEARLRALLDEKG